jgi:molybdate transport system regulatory protein
MQIGYRIWLDNNGKAFGKGPKELLKRVEAANSLRQAAAQMDMSYSKAWKMINHIEDNLGFPLLERTAGGLAGGGSKLTPQAKKLLTRYDQLEKDVQKAMAKVYWNRFGIWWGKETKRNEDQCSQHTKRQNQNGKARRREYGNSD